jgi:hypothetical protein
MKYPTYRSAISEVARRIGTGIDKSHAALLEGRVEQEPAMTDRMLGRIEESIDGLEIKGIRWTAKTLTDRGKHAQEPKDGADFMCVLDVDLPDYRITKGFLAQAKLIRRDGFNDFRELYKQCVRMLELSPAAYVFVYTEKGVDIFPASGVVASNGRIDKLEKRSATRFFKAHLQCYIGDQRISAATPDQLLKLRDSEGVDRALLISAKPAW